MLDALRERMNKSPWIGWAIAGLLLVVAAWVIVRGGRSSDPYSTDQLGEIVTLVCRETGEEFKLTRGEMERQLMHRPLPIDPEQGLANPKTGTMTLFPKSEWHSTIERITADRTAMRESRRRGGKAAGAE